MFRSALLGLLGGVALLVTLSPRKLLAIAGSMLAGYYGLLRIPFGELNQPLLDPDNNLAAALDRQIANLFHGELHSGALWNVTHDPEGLLSSLPALATVLSGSVAALHMRDRRYSPEQKALHFAGAGLVSLAAGHVGIERFRSTRTCGRVRTCWCRRAGHCWPWRGFIGYTTRSRQSTIQWCAG